MRQIDPPIRSICLKTLDRPEAKACVLHALIDTGIWHALSGSAAKLLVILTTHWPGRQVGPAQLASIADLAGLSAEEVEQAIAALQRYALLEVSYNASTACCDG